MPRSTMPAVPWCSYHAKDRYLLAHCTREKFLPCGFLSALVSTIAVAGVAQAKEGTQRFIAFTPCNNQSPDGFFIVLIIKPGKSWQARVLGTIQPEETREVSTRRGQPAVPKPVIASASDPCVSSVYLPDSCPCRLLYRTANVPHNRYVGERPAQPHHARHRQTVFC